MGFCALITSSRQEVEPSKSVQPYPSRAGGGARNETGLGSENTMTLLPFQFGRPLADAPFDGAALRRRVHARLVAEADAAALARLGAEALEETTREMVGRQASSEGLTLTTRQFEAATQAVLQELIGLGPLEPLLADDGISEIMVNGPYSVYVERGGRLTRAEAIFDDDAHLRRIIERIVSPLGRRVDDSSPLADARLPDGSRVNIILPPLAVAGPVVTIRKFARRPLRTDDLVRLGTLTPQAEDFLAGVRWRAAERAGLRRHGQRQDDDSECPVGVYRRG